MEIILKDKNGVILHTNKKYCKEDISVKVDDSLILDTSDATATADDIAKDKTAYVNGERVVGVAEVNDNNAEVLTTVPKGDGYKAGVTTVIKKLSGNFSASSTDASYMFYYLPNLESIKGTIDVSNATNLLAMFCNSSKLVEIPELDTSKATNMQNMFAGCHSIKTISLPNTSNVTNMATLCQNCQSVESVTLGDTSKVTNVKNMFQNCYLLKHVTDMDLSSVSGSNMDFMFDACSAIETLPNLILNTTNTYSMGAMFRSCTNLKNVPVYNVSMATSMVNAFYKCPNLTYESINNIMATCATAGSSYTATKTLVNVGLSSSNYDSATIQGLSNYQAFIDAGWTIGY